VVIDCWSPPPLLLPVAVVNCWSPPLLGSQPLSASGKPDHDLQHAISLAAAGWPRLSPERRCHRLQLLHSRRPAASTTAASTAAASTAAASTAAASTAG